jgi:hypothetical protein
MKKILILVMFSSIASVSFSESRFNFSIPQPDMISNDWDGDGKINSLDEDDDGDGILDINDETPFGNPKDVITIEEASGIASFASDVSEIFLGQTVNFSWSIDETSNLTLYGGSLPNLGYDVTGLNSATDSPIGDTTYILYSNTGNKSVDVGVLPIPVVNSFTLNGLSSNIEINTGDGVNILWSIDEGKNISLTGGGLVNQVNLSESGSISDNPSENTSYSLFDGLNTTVLSVIVTNPCSFDAGSGASPWNNWTTVWKLDDFYQFYINGVKISIGRNPSIDGYTIGAYKGTQAELTSTDSSAELYEICSTN